MRSRTRNGGTKNTKRDRLTASPNTTEQNDAAMPDTTVSKAASKKKRVTKAQKKDQSKQQTPTKRSRHAATVRKQKSGEGEPHNENTFDRPDDVNLTTNAKQARRQAKDPGALFPMTPLKADVLDSNQDAAQGSLPQPSDDTPMPSQTSERPLDEIVKPLDDQLGWIALDGPDTAAQNDDAAAERSEGEPAPKRRRRRSYEPTNAIVPNPARMNGVQREELNKINERKLDDLLERVMA